MVAGAAVFPVVAVVAGKVGMDPGKLQHLRHGVVEGLQRGPAPVEEIVPPGMGLPPGRHAGQTARVGVFKGNGMFRQTPEIRGVDPAAAIGRQEPAVQRVKHDHDGFHCFCAPFLLS